MDIKVDFIILGGIDEEESYYYGGCWKRFSQF